MSQVEIVRLQSAVTERDHMSGSAGAPVTLVEYGNFECIHCARAYPVIKAVKKLLGDDLRFVYRNFPTVRTDPRSVRAAEAAEAAGAQGKFWEMHDELFAHQRDLEDAHLWRYAKRIGLDIERFAREMTENVYLQQIEADFEHSLFAEHITGTPTFYINEVRYTGGTDVESFLATMRLADTEGRIRLPEGAQGIGSLLMRLRRRYGA